MTLSMDLINEHSSDDDSPLKELKEYFKKAMAWKSDFHQTLHDIPVNATNIYELFITGASKRYYKQLEFQETEQLLTDAFLIMKDNEEVVRKMTKKGQKQHIAFINLYEYFQDSQSQSLVHHLRPIIVQSSLINHKATRDRRTTAKDEFQPRLIAPASVKSIHSIMSCALSIKLMSMGAPRAEIQQKISELFVEFEGYLDAKLEQDKIALREVQTTVSAFNLILEIAAISHQHYTVYNQKVSESIVQKITQIIACDFNQTVNVYDSIKTRFPKLARPFLRSRFKVLLQSERARSAASASERMIIDLNTIKANAESDHTSNKIRSTFEEALEQLNIEWNPKQMIRYEYSCIKLLLDKLLKASKSIDAVVDRNYEMINRCDLENTLKHIVRNLQRYQSDIKYVVHVSQNTYPEIAAAIVSDMPSKC